MFAFSLKMTFDKVSNISTNCKNILGDVIPFFHQFAGEQVTSEWVSHELSGSVRKQTNEKRKKRKKEEGAVQSFTQVCFVSPGQLKLNVFWSLFRAFIPFLIQTAAYI